MEPLISSKTLSKSTMTPQASQSRPKQISKAPGKGIQGGFSPLRHSEEDVTHGSSQASKGNLDYKALQSFLSSAQGALAPVETEAAKNLPKGRQRRMMSSDTAVISQTQVVKADQLKRQAYSLYQRKDYFDALLLFQKAVAVFKLQDLSPRLKLTQPQVFSIISECYLKSSTCYLRIQQFDQAIRLLNQVLDVEKQNSKALFIRGKCFQGKNQLRAALLDLEQASELQKENKVIQQALKQVRDRIRKSTSSDFLPPGSTGDTSTKPDNLDSLSHSLETEGSFENEEIELFEEPQPLALKKNQLVPQQEIIYEEPLEEGQEFAMVPKKENPLMKSPVWQAVLQLLKRQAWRLALLVIAIFFFIKFRKYLRINKL